MGLHACACMCVSVVHRESELARCTKMLPNRIAHMIHACLSVYVCMYEKVATVTVSIEETVPLGQGERGPDRDSYFPNQAIGVFST